MQTNSENIFEALREDHNLHRALADKIVETSGDTAARMKLYEQFKVELLNHAKAEERAFYAPLLADAGTQDLATHSLVEHEELEGLVAEIDETEMDSPNWLKRFKHLAHRVEHHEAEEEKEVFPVAGKSLTEAQKKSFAADYAAAMKAEAA